MYTKLFGEILHSTVWSESIETKIVWITMLALVDDRSEVRASVIGLAKAAGVTVPQCEKALKCFMSPDKYSRSQEFEGRRIEECDGGWKMLNERKYREMRSAEERREYQKKWKAEKRAREKLYKTKRDKDTETDEEGVTKGEMSQSCHDNKDININKDINKPKDKKPTFVVPEFINKELWKEWLAVRRKLKAVNSETALKALVTRLTKIHESGKFTVDEAITVAIEKSWKSVELEWLENIRGNNNGNTSKPKLTKLQRAEAAFRSDEYEVISNS